MIYENTSKSPLNSRFYDTQSLNFELGRQVLVQIS